MNRYTVATIALAAGLCLVPTVASAQGNGSYPSNERPTTYSARPNRPLLIGSSALIAASYIPAVVVAASSDREGDKWLYVPVVGPWADLFDREGCGGGCGTEAVNKTLLIGAGLAHIVGVGGVIASLALPEDRSRTAALPQKPHVQVSPMNVGRSGYGLGLVGAF